MLRALGLTFAGLLLSGTVLTGCSGDEGEPADAGTTDSPTASASPSPYPSAPDTVTLTDPGTDLALGESATIAWQPVQALVGVLDISVTAMERATFQAFRGWQIDDATRQQAPYFVRATIVNAGETDLSTQPVPLYALDAAGAPIQASTFGGEFEPCRPSALPAPFPPGASADVCLVYLLPSGGTLAGVIFRPTDAFEPIVWSGTVTDFQAPSRKGPPPAATTGTATPTATPTS